MSKKIKQLPIFVYGTLMKGHPNHFNIFGNIEVETVAARMYGVTLVKPSRRAPFPYMVNSNVIPEPYRFTDDSDAVVYGELLYLPAEHYEKMVQNMDRLEGVPDHYERRTAKAYLRDAKKPVNCYVYSLPDELVSYLFFDPIIRNGDWASEVRAQKLYPIRNA